MLSFNAIQSTVDVIVDRAFYETGEKLSRSTVVVLKDCLTQSLWQQLSPDSLISFGEAARILGISVRTVHRIANERQLPTIKFGSNRRSIRRRDLTKWVDEHEEAINRQA
jgi:excisionase family DNA binding protein